MKRRKVFVAQRRETGKLKGVNEGNSTILKTLAAFLLGSRATAQPANRWRRYGIAIAAVLVAFAIRFLLGPFVGSDAPFILFVPALILAGLFGGLGPSLLASALSLVLASRFIAASGTWFPRNFHDFLVGAIYVGSALVIVGLVSVARHVAVQLQREVNQRKQAENELRRSETRLQQFLDYTQNIVFLKDLEGHYILVNRKFLTFTGLQRDEILGKTDAELFPTGQGAVFHENDLKVLETGSSQEFEEPFFKDNEEYTYLVNKIPLRDAAGKIFALGGIATDITSRKRAEQEMCKAREGYADLVDSVDGIVWEALPNPFRFIFVSQKAERLLLYPVERWTSEKDFWENHLHPQDRQWASQYCSKSLREEKDHDFSYRMIAADGRTVWLRDIVKVNVKPDGEIRIRGVMVDITEQKKVEQALRESEEKLRILADTAGDAIISADRYGNIIQFNRAAERIFGYTPAQIRGQQVTLLLPERYRDRIRNDLATFFETRQVSLLGATTEIAALRRDGTEFPIELSLSTWQTSSGTFFTGIIRDITERKRASEALRRSEEQLRMTAEGAGADLWTWDVEKDLLECPSIHAPFGFDEPVPLQTYLSHVHPEDRAMLRDEVQRCLLEKRDLNIEFRVVWPSGETGWRHSRGRPTYREGRAVRFSGISLDITKRKEAELALRQNEALLRMTTEGASIGLWQWQIDTGMIHLNSIAARQLGLRAGESMPLETFVNSIHPEDRETLRAAIQRCVEGRTKIDVEYRLQYPSGIRWIHCKGHVTAMDGKPRVLSGMSLDITDRKEAEEALEAARSAIANHAQELERLVTERTAQLQTSVRDMETFCYNIAHDLRAPLRGMRGFVFALEEDYGATLDETARLYCERIRESSDRMDQLISDLLTFGRLSHVELPTQIVDLNEEIEKVLAHSSGELEEKHAEIELDKPLPKVCADAPVLDQILENLIVNAVKFVPPERHPHVHIYAESHDGFVRIWVEDNGIGIAAEHHNRIFGPFQRLHTNEAYPGTGIGLAIVQRGVEKMGGHVGVESEPGKGSRFWIELPSEHNHSGRGAGSSK